MDLFFLQILNIMDKKHSYCIIIFWETSDIAQEIKKQISTLYDHITIPSRTRKEKKSDILSKIKPYWYIIVINCVWKGIYGMSHEVSHQQFQQGFESNFLVPIDFFQRIITLQQEKLRSKCHFININSYSWLHPTPQWIAYNSFKSALSMAIKIITKEHKKNNISTHEFFPGMIQTKMINDMPYIPKKNIQKIDTFWQEVVDYIISYINKNE